MGGLLSDSNQFSTGLDNLHRGAQEDLTINQLTYLVYVDSSLARGASMIYGEPQPGWIT